MALLIWIIFVILICGGAFLIAHVDAEEHTRKMRGYKYPDEK